MGVPSFVPLSSAKDVLEELDRKCRLQINLLILSFAKRGRSSDFFCKQVKKAFIMSCRDLDLFKCMTSTSFEVHQAFIALIGSSDDQSFQQRPKDGAESI